MSTFVLDFKDISLNDISKVGGKNASLGEMFQKLTNNGICIPDGFAITAEAYWRFIDRNNLRGALERTLRVLDVESFSNLHIVGEEARRLVLNGRLPEEITFAITNGFHRMSEKYMSDIQLAVRSSATAEDLPDASFAGQHESFLNVSGLQQLLTACLNCYASLFTDRAIKYRHLHGFDNMKVALSIGVQKMVRSDLASAGVAFTLDPESGFTNTVYITGSWGLGENVVQGAVNPDEFYIFKPSLRKKLKSIIGKKMGSKAHTMIYDVDENARQHIKNTETPQEKRQQYILSDTEVTKLAQWSLLIEEHYGRPMDIEWAKDGITGNLFVVQARPETVHSNADKSIKHTLFLLKEKGTVLASGKGIGNKITSGIARILNSSKDIDLLKEGEVLVTDITNPDWDPILKKASAIITNKGGRTSHAAIVARELGAVGIVGTGNGTERIKDGQMVTVSCAEGGDGFVYKGKLRWEEREEDFSAIEMPETKVLLIIADPDQAFQLSFYPNSGVGLMRLEFVINNTIKIHPMALIKFDELKDQETKELIQKMTHGYANKEEYFVEKLSEGVATIAAAFYPKEVIVRMSDFKTNEYSNLIGGKEFEPVEENPMLGFRGASRYYHAAYKEGFRLECQAMKIVRNDMGLTNIKLMIPFCRTVIEGRNVIEIMEQHGLKRGSNGLEIYVMAEVPSNVILADKFAQIFDGFSIGSNDLTQLTLGIDRDSSVISELFDENDEASKFMISSVIKTVKRAGKNIGLCGQAPSDKPEYAEFLVEQQIDSISFNADSLYQGILNIKAAEQKRNVAFLEGMV